jgi:hypothetical protein
MCLLSNYKDIFGKPKQGIHQYRVLDTPKVDYMLTLFAALITTYLAEIPLVLTTIMLMVLSIIVHTIFGVETDTTLYLGLNKLTSIGPFKCS